jgi:DNA-binding response OmpR family regulator
MNPKPDILLIDDDANIRKLIQLYLEKEGFVVEEADRGDKGLDAFRQTGARLVLLDIMMPGMDGWEVCRQIRTASNVPILMLTAKVETLDKVQGLELGADDYLTKPFEPSELVARVKALLRRSADTAQQPAEPNLSYPGLTIDHRAYLVHLEDSTLELPPKEMELLCFLVSHPNQVFTREQLLEQVWGFEYFGDSRTVDVHVKRLREKLNGCVDVPWQIKTVWGVGYKFEGVLRANEER